MGGFLYNGCGASDSYKKIQGLGSYYCKCCKKIREFGLFELDRKVRIFFVPTVTLNTKYAVICEKCKTGIYVEGDIRDALMRNQAKAVIGEEGIRFAFMTVPIEKQAPEKQAPVKQDPVKQAQKVQPEESLQPSEQMQKLTASLQSLAASKKLMMPEDEKRNEKSDVSSFVIEKKICPKCNLFYSRKKLYCDVCGSRLIEG